jgi:hypothetical protein
MRTAVVAGLGAGCVVALSLACFGPVLLEGEQFAHRDAAQYYYPLYHRVQQEWQAGRWPLWDPGQNGGQPLLGTPMAAVLYPGKIVYAVLPYAWAARLYIVAHVVWAFLGMAAFARALGTSGTGAALSGLSYAFGVPVLFQYCNVIFLVGAAWLPWGLRAAVRLVERGRRAAIAELAVVLTMQVLGGDSQAAYLTALCGFGYAALVWVRAHRRPVPRSTRLRVLIPVAAVALVAVWIGATLALAYRRATVPGWVGPFWIPAVLGWAVVGAAVVRRLGRTPDDPLRPRLLGLAAAVVLALGLSAAQLLPAIEFTGQSNRTGAVSVLSVERFSTDPLRLAECVWPTVFGYHFPENRTWIHLLPPVNDHHFWVPSLYVGGLALLLGLAGAGLRGGSTHRTWLTAIALLGLTASFGKFASPLWWVRWLPGAAEVFGPHEPLFGLPRTDTALGDGTGSPYSALLGALLPGFSLFRYTSKLLVLTAAAFAALGGIGWDEAMGGRSRRFARGAALALGSSAALLVLALLFRGAAVAYLGGRLPDDELTGPPDAAGAWAETLRALGHGTIVYALALALAVRGPRWPRAAGALAMVVLTADLAVAGARFVWTVPQAVLDRPSDIVERIAAAERTDPAAGPFRVHRLDRWHPDRFRQRRSPARVRELEVWEHATLQDLRGLDQGIARTTIAGMLEQDDYLLFFRPRTVPAEGDTARALGVAPGAPVFYYPRRAYDLWGTRYFLVPVGAHGWGTGRRGYASFVPNTEIVAPDASVLGNAQERRRWFANEDWQLLRNLSAYPRAWLVHHARVVQPPADLDSRLDLIDAINYQADRFWHVPGRRVDDPRTLVWIESADRDALRGAVVRAPVQPGESVTVVRHEPQRVELRAHLTLPGIVVLADAYYPGWRLTIDGRPAPILRADRMMRAAAVAAGEHTLVYVYDPASFRIGLAVSMLTLVPLLGLIAWSARGGQLSSASVE